MRSRIGEAYDGFRSRRGLLKQLGVAGAAGLAVGAVSPAAEAAPASRAARYRLPVGTWSVAITVEGQPETERAHFSFHADGQLVMQSLVDGTTQTGIGSWRPKHGGFVYTMRRLRAGEDGAFLCEVRIRQEARFTSAGAFVSEGKGTAVDADGNVLMEVRATAAGTRFGIDD